MTTLAHPERPNSPTEPERLGQVLGLSRPVASDRELLHLVAERLEPAAVESLKAHGLNARQIAALIIPTPASRIAAPARNA